MRDTGASIGVAYITVGFRGPRVGPGPPPVPAGAGRFPRGERPAVLRGLRGRREGLPAGGAVGRAPGASRSAGGAVPVRGGAGGRGRRRGRRRRRADVRRVRRVLRGGRGGVLGGRRVGRRGGAAELGVRGVAHGRGRRVLGAGHPRRGDVRAGGRRRAGHRRRREEHPRRPGGTYEGVRAADRALQAGIRIPTMNRTAPRTVSPMSPKEEATAMITIPRIMMNSPAAVERVRRGPTAPGTPTGPGRALHATPIISRKAPMTRRRMPNRMLTSTTSEAPATRQTMPMTIPATPFPVTMVRILPIPRPKGPRQPRLSRSEGSRRATGARRSGHRPTRRDSSPGFKYAGP